MDTLHADIGARLPWDRPSDALRYSAAVKGVTLIENSTLDDRVVAVIAHYVRVLTDYDEPTAQLLLGVLQGGVPVLAVMCVNQFLADLDSVHADLRDEWLTA